MDDALIGFLVAGCAPLVDAELADIIRLFVETQMPPRLLEGGRMRLVQNDRDVRMLIEAHRTTFEPAEDNKIKWVIDFSTSWTAGGDVMPVEIQQFRDGHYEVVGYVPPAADGDPQSERVSVLANLVRSLGTRTDAALAILDFEELIDKARASGGSAVLGWLTIYNHQMTECPSQSLLAKAPLWKVRKLGPELTEVQLAEDILAAEPYEADRRNLERYFARHQCPITIGGPRP